MSRSHGSAFPQDSSPVPDPPERDARWRQEYPVLAPNASSVAMLGVIRSLGRAGYPVHAVAPRGDAIGLRSQFTARASISPPPGPELIPWLRDYAARHGIRGIAPDGTLLPDPAFRDLLPLVPVARDEGVVRRAFSKFETFERLLAPRGDTRAAAHLPPMLHLRDGQMPSQRQLEGLGSPLFVKTDAIHARAGGAGRCRGVSGPAEALRVIERLWRDYDRVVIQGFVPGLGAAASFVVWEGRRLSEFMNLCLHEAPHSGGFCTLRESWFHAGMLEDARIKIRELEWEGAGMLEYRWNRATGDFWLIEFNPRFWAGLHTALFAGMDMPRILFDAFFGRPGEPQFEYRRGVRARFTFPFEIGHVVSRWREGDLPYSARAWSVLEFVLLSCDPRARADHFYPGDRAVYFRQLWNVVKSYWRG